MSAALWVPLLPVAEAASGRAWAFVNSVVNGSALEQGSQLAVVRCAVELHTLVRNVAPTKLLQGEDDPFCTRVQAGRSAPDAIPLSHWVLTPNGRAVVDNASQDQ